MKWLPNPYVIAQRLANAPNLLSIIRSDGKTADAFLRDMFVSRGRRQKTVISALRVFRDIADLFDSPVPLSQAIDKSKEIWAREGYSAEEIARVLPHIAPTMEPVSSGGFADADKLIVDSVSYLDPVQGDTGDCYLISAMSALAWTKRALLTTRLNEAGFAPPASRSFEWRFHKDTGAVDGPLEVSGRIMMDGSTPRYARSTSPGEDWPSLLEKAYVAKVCGVSDPTRANYRSIDAKNEGSLPSNACQALSGGDVQGMELDTEEGRRIFTSEGLLGTRSGVMLKPVMAWTKVEEDLEENNRDAWDATGIWPRHAYAVLGVMRSNDRVTHVVIRNPYGAKTDKSREGYHDGPWDPDGRPPVPLNENGVFAISRKLFYDNFEDIGWVDH